MHLWCKNHPNIFTCVLSKTSGDTRLFEVSAELLEAQVNPAVWEISGHMVLKCKKDFDGATGENAWRHFPEVSLSVERFQEASDSHHLWSHIMCGYIETKSFPDEDERHDVEDVDVLNNGSHLAAIIVAGKQKYLVQHYLYFHNLDYST